LDSIERHVQNNLLVPSILFNYEAGYTTYSRVELLTKPDGLLGYPLAAFRQAWFGDFADRLVVLPYDTLTERPGYAMERLYEILDLAPFSHDFENVGYDEPQFDAMLALPGFHKVHARVTANIRDPIVPPDLFQIYDSNFWNDPDQNPRAVTVI
jgi:sulfotransferase